MIMLGILYKYYPLKVNSSVDFRLIVSVILVSDSFQFGHFYIINRGDYRERPIGPILWYWLPQHRQGNEYHNVCHVRNKSEPTQGSDGTDRRILRTP